MKVCGISANDLIGINPIVLCTMCRHIPSNAYECGNCHKIVGSKCIPANCMLCGFQLFKQSAAANAFINKLQVTHMPCKFKIPLNEVDSHRKHCKYAGDTTNTRYLITSQLIKDVLISSGIKEGPIKEIEKVLLNIREDTNLELQTYKEYAASLEWNSEFNIGMKVSKSGIKCRAILPTLQYSTMLTKRVYQ